MGISTSKPQTSWKEYVDKIKAQHVPSEVCTQEKIDLIKAQNIIKIKEIIQEKSKVLNEFEIDIKNLIVIDNESQETITIDSRELKKNCKLTDTDLQSGIFYFYLKLYIPKTYKNGFDIIINNEEIVDILKSVLVKPFIFTPVCQGQFIIKYVHL